MTQQTYDTFWQQRFAKRIQELINAQAEMVCGGGAQDHAAYKELTGTIRGLRMALGAINEVNDDIKKAEQGRN